MKRKLCCAMLFSVLLLVPFYAEGQDQKAPMPPAKVVVADIREGKTPPVNTFVGTIFYSEVADVASEAAGIVETVGIEEGQRVKKGALFIRLNADILQKRLQATEAAYEQSLAELEKARLDFARVENLYKRQSVAQQLYDEHRFLVKSLEKKAESLKAEVDGLRAEVEKKTVRAPFSGVVLNRVPDQGEWVSPGQAVATLAKDDILEVVVDVPEAVVRFVRPGDEVHFEAGGKTLAGKVFTLIPQGDMATRTFPVKIRAPQNGDLMEGMEARVTLPVGESRVALLMPRDALVSAFGVDTIFVIKGSKAEAVPVEIIGFQGQTVGVHAEGVEPGMQVVVKGNERLQSGQPVEAIHP